MIPHSDPSVITVKDSSFLSTTLAFFALALMITAVGTYTGFFLISSEMIMNPAFYYLAIIGELILVITANSWSQKLPFGYGMFALFAFLSGFTLVPILGFAGAVGGAPLIMKALISSVSVFTAAALYGWTTHRSLQGLRGFLMMSLIGILLLSLLSFFFPWNNSMELIVSSVTVLIFAGFTMVDIQNLENNYLKNPLLSAISLYLNFINLFTSIVRILIAMKGRD